MRIIVWWRDREEEKTNWQNHLNAKDISASRKKTNKQKKQLTFRERVWYDAKVNQFLKDAIICAIINGVALHRILKLNLGRVWACGAGYTLLGTQYPRIIFWCHNKQKLKRKTNKKKPKNKNGQCQSFICTRKSAF